MSKTPLCDKLEADRKAMKAERTPAYGDALALARRLETALTEALAHPPLSFRSPHEFGVFLRAVIAEHPEWLTTALHAVVGGLADDNQRLRAQRAEQDRGLMAALTLLKDNRITQETRDQMNVFLRRGILMGLPEEEKHRLCPLEIAFLEKTDPLGRYFKADPE